MVELVVQWKLDTEALSTIQRRPISPTVESSTHQDLLRFSLLHAPTTATPTTARQMRARDAAMASEDEENDSSTSSNTFENATRVRMSIEQRRARHREAQRQFAVRKKHQLAELRSHVQSLTVRYQYLNSIQEIGRLRNENATLQTQLEALDRMRFLHETETG